MPWDHSLQKHLVRNVLGFRDTQTVVAQSQEELVLLRASQGLHGVKRLPPQCGRCLLLPHLHEDPSARGLLQHLALAHLPNTWAKLWKRVLCDTCQGGCDSWLALGVWHFTIKMCKIPSQPLCWCLGMAPLGQHFHHGFLSFPSASTFLLSVLKSQEELFWLENGEHRNSPTYKRTWLRVWKAFPETSEWL